MKAFVTGGSGFIGRRVVQKLLERGYTVYALARTERSVALLEALGATPVRGDITDTESMRAAMRGSDVVFHLAARYQLGDTNWRQAEVVNVGGTRRVLTLAHELGIPKIVYTSTTAVFSHTKGKLVDETYATEGPFLSTYERTKWLAHYKVALPLIKQGAPIIIVMPGQVYGPGDPGYIGALMERFYLNKFPFPILPGPDTALSYTYVDDVAEGHILAAEKGRLGESYILAGPAVPLGEMADFWARLTGKRPPMLHVPSAFLRPFAPLMHRLGQSVDLPQLFSGEALASLGTTYMARADKARAQLGWRPRSLHAGMLETFASIAAEAAERPLPAAREREIATVALGAAAVIFVAWLFFRHRPKR